MGIYFQKLIFIRCQHRSITYTEILSFFVSYFLLRRFHMVFYQYASGSLRLGLNLTKRQRNIWASAVFMLEANDTNVDIREL